MGAAAGGIIGGASGGISSGFSTAEKMEESRAAGKRNQYEQRIADENTKLALYGAVAARQRGQQEEAASRAKYADLRGNQIAGYGASGVVATSGSAANAVARTEALSDYDAAVLRNNAAREAWGYQMKAREFQRRKGLLQAEYDNLKKGRWMTLASGVLGAGGAVGGGVANAVSANNKSER